jgi:hypothetical protein
VVEEFVTIVEEDSHTRTTPQPRPETQQIAIPIDDRPGQNAPEDHPQHESRDPSRSAFWVNPEEAECNANEDAVTRDDSDILVIEDEVEVQRVDEAKRYDSLDQTISVDFQAMLSRMRSGSKS